jgi:hypothetical protein
MSRDEMNKEEEEKLAAMIVNQVDDAEYWEQKLFEQLAEQDEEAQELRAAFGIVPDGRSLKDQLLEIAHRLRQGPHENA